MLLMVSCCKIWFFARVIAVIIAIVMMSKSFDIRSSFFSLVLLLYL